MNIWNKVLIGLIIVASLLFTFFGMRALKTHQYWRQRVQKMEKDYETLQQQNVVLQDGDRNTKGVRQKKLALHKLLMNRGRLWLNVTPGEFNPETGALSVTTDQPTPNGIDVGTVLYLFSQAPVQDGGRYLGAFNVTNKADKQLQLQPGLMLTRTEVERLQNAPKPWVMYDVIPTDEREVFAKLDEAAKQAMLPEGSVQEYLKDGKAEADGTQYTRRLRDYSVILNDEYRQRSLLFELVAAAKVDNHYLQNALAEARRQEQFHNAEIQKLKATLAEEQRQLGAVKEHLGAVEKKLAEVQGGIKQLTEANRSAVGQIARIQMEATRQIDQQTQSMAQTTK